MKNVVITGSTRGLGLCMAKEFLKAGCRVTVSGRSDASLESAQKELAEFGDKVLYIPCNVRQRDDLEKLWQKSAQQWGSVDIWINNAGQNTPYVMAYDTDPEYVDAVIDTNIKGMIYASQIAIKHMIAQGKGQLWNMEGLGSNDAIQIKTILYGTSKAALTYFTKGLAKELGEAGVSICAGRLSPGMMLTDFITKTPEGEHSPVLENQAFRKIFNILGDRPEDVAAFFIPRILANEKNDAHIVWLDKWKIMKRFASVPFQKRKLID